MASLVQSLNSEESWFSDKRMRMKGYEVEQTQMTSMNVVSLFNRSMETVEIENDPMKVLLQEGELSLDEDFELLGAKTQKDENRKVVQQDQFPDQSIYILDEQLKKLRTSLNRIRFYLGDMDDLLPR